LQPEQQELSWHFPSSERFKHGMQEAVKAFLARCSPALYNQTSQLLWYAAAAAAANIHLVS
jgi:hypothetical protein